MTINLIGNSFKYEMEAVCKLFFPFEKVVVTFDAPVTEDPRCACLRLRRTRKGIRLLVLVRYDKQTQARHQTVSSDTPPAECERLFACMLFDILAAFTGVRPGWGVLTGIRPVKRIHYDATQGLSQQEIHARLRQDFYVSEDKLRLAQLTADHEKPLLDSLPPHSFSLYVSIPFCPTRCNYCSFVSQAMAQAVKLIPDYLDCLCQELVSIASLARDCGLTLDTIYVGGGTPTSLTATQLDRVLTVVSSQFDLSHLREYTVEAGRPDTVTQDKLDCLKHHGVTRVSINPQTMDNCVLEAIGRRHTAEQTIQAYEMARHTGFAYINMDLIAGLLFDTAEGFRRSLDIVRTLSPENITVHTLSLKRAAQLYHDGASLDRLRRNPIADMVSYAQQALIADGYAPYYLYRQKNTLGNQENVGYAQKGCESLYNVYIMEEVQTILAAGAAASTKLVPEHGKIQRVYNYKYPFEYIRSFDEILRRKDAVRTFF